MTAIATEPHLPVFRPSLGPEVRQAVADALDAGWISIGKLTYQFEDALSQYLGLDHEDAICSPCRAARPHSTAPASSPELGLATKS